MAARNVPLLAQALLGEIDPNEIPGIEAMGVTNCKSLAEVPDPVDYAD